MDLDEVSRVVATATPVEKLGDRWRISSAEEDRANARLEVISRTTLPMLIGHVRALELTVAAYKMPIGPVSKDLPCRERRHQLMREATPELQAYIGALETIADPAMMVQDIADLRQQRDGLAVKVKHLARLGSAVCALALEPDMDHDAQCDLRAKGRDMAKVVPKPACDCSIGKLRAAVAALREEAPTDEDLEPSVSEGGIRA